MSAISPQSEPGQTPANPASPVAASEGADGASTPHPPEFRRYRRFVNTVALVFIFLSAGYLLLSVTVTIYRQRTAGPAVTPINVALTKQELAGCWQELHDVTVALEKYLEKSHYLLGVYDQVETQRWANEGEIWRNQWRALGERCRFDTRPRAPVPPEFDDLQAAHRELGDTATIYTKELLRFGREQAPRLDRLRSRINNIGKRLAPP